MNPRAWPLRAGAGSGDGDHPVDGPDDRCRPARRRLDGVSRSLPPLAQLGAIAVAFAALTWAYVRQRLHRLQRRDRTAIRPSRCFTRSPAKVWGNHEGSMVLWVLILAMFGAMVAGFGRNLPPTLKARVLGIQGMIGRRASCCSSADLQSVSQGRAAAARRPGPEPAAAGSGPRLPSAIPLFRLCRLLDASASPSPPASRGRVDAAWARWSGPSTLAALSGLTLGPSRWAAGAGITSLGWGGLVVLGPRLRTPASCPG